MLQDCRGATSCPFREHDVQSRKLRDPASQAEGTVNGTALELPAKGIQVTFLLQSGAITGTPTLDAKIQESADGSTGWTDLVSFPTGVVANTVKSVVATTTKKWVRYVSVVNGTTVTIIHGASLVF